MLAGDDAERSRRCGDAERDDGRGDAIVEAALDVENPPDTGRETFVADHRRAQCGIRRRQAGSDQAGQGERQAGKQDHRHGCAGEDRQWEADGQQAAGEWEVPPCRSWGHRGGVAEQQQGKRQLRQRMDRGAFDVDAADPPVGVRQEQAGDHEDERPGQVMT